MKIIRVLIIVLSVVLCTISCTKIEDFDEKSSDSTGVSQMENFPGTKKTSLPIKWDVSSTGGVWNTTFTQEPTSLNPFANLDDSHAVITGIILDYLFFYNFDKKEWEGNIVDSWQTKVINTTGEMELICKLKDEIFWSDGVQMTADDVVFSYNKLDGNPDLNPRNYQGHLIKMEDGSEKLVVAKTIDKLTWKYIFPRQLASPELQVNTGRIVPKHIWEPVLNKGIEAVRNFWSIDTPPEQLVSNGPFLLESYKPAERLIFKRNPNYWKKDEDGNSLPYIEKIVSSFVPESNTTADLLKFQQGEIEAYGLKGQDMASLLPDAEKKDYTIWNGGISTSYPFLTFNMNPALGDDEKVKLFSDKRFRHAVSCLIDRRTIIDTSLNGFAEPCYHLFGDNNKYYNPKYETPYKYDPEKAISLLKEIGLEDKNGDGVLQYPSGKDVTFSLMSYSQDTIVHDFLNIILSDMEKVGIKGTLEVVDFNLWIQKMLNTYDWDCTLHGSSFPTFPQQWYNRWQSRGNLHYWYPKQKSPATDWEKRIDELNALLEYTIDEEQIQSLYDEFQQILIDQLPMIPLYNKYTFSAVYNKWGNINWDSKHSLGDDLRRTYLKNEYREP
ncbi:MAG: ABC transporter substrate-binding protein [Spirochaetales bacterium]|nr:ABC transporter substrate-binding protein [Spirochaetales bacterium]